MFGFTMQQKELKRVIFVYYGKENGRVLDRQGQGTRDISPFTIQNQQKITEGSNLTPL